MSMTMRHNTNFKDSIEEKEEHKTKKRKIKKVHITHLVSFNQHKGERQRESEREKEREDTVQSDYRN